MIEAQPLDIQSSDLYSSYSYDYPMELQQTIFRYSPDSDSTSRKVVGVPLNQGAKKLYKNKEWLEQKYIDEKLSIREIGRKYDSNNLISLCLLCHLSTNETRQYWANYFQNIIGIRLMLS